jgi:SAM-dependent methyltransferase
MVDQKDDSRRTAEGYFASRFPADPRRDGVWKALCAYLQRFVPEAGAVLDLGAGYCSFINHIRAADRHALDSFPGFTAHAAPGVTAHVGRCEELSLFPANRFDTVFASNLLEHLTREETEKTLGEVLRVLKPGGRLLLLQPNFRTAYRTYFDDFTHVQIFTHVSLADLLAARGFLVEEVRPRFLPFTLKSRWPAWPWLVALYLRLPFRPLARQMLVVARTPSSKPT